MNDNIHANIQTHLHLFIIIRGSTYTFAIIDEKERCNVTRTASVFKDCLLFCPTPLSHAVSLHVSTYITQTLLQHFNLYYYLVNHQQQESLTSADMLVHTAEKDILPLQSGIELSEWEKSEKVREIEKLNSLRESDMKEAREISVTEEKKEIEMAEGSILSALHSKGSSGVTEKEIQAMVTMLTETRAKQLLSSLTHELLLQEGNVGVRVDSLVVRAVPHSGSKQDQELSAKRTAVSSRESGRKSKS